MSQRDEVPCPSEYSQGACYEAKVDVTSGPTTGEVAVLQIQLVQFFQLKAQQRHLGTGIQAALAQRVELLLIAAPVPAQASHVIAQAGLAQELIQQAQMRGAIE